MTHIIRIIDIDGKTVTFVTGTVQHTVDWPQDIPTLGDVYAATLAPVFKLHDKLATGGKRVDRQNGDSLRWRKPLPDGQTRMDILAARHKIKRALQNYFDAAGFLEIDMPLLVRGTTPDAEVPSFAVDDRYLVTSCEYQIKRMEIGGFDKLYTLTQNFRAQDHGTYRNPEFTMLEWARVNATLSDIETDAENFIRAAWQALHGNQPFAYQGRTIDITAPWQRQTVCDALSMHTGVTVCDFRAETLLTAAQTLGIAIAQKHAEDANFLFSVVFEEIQPRLGLDRPVFITAWPQHMTASADVDGSGTFTARSELFIAGIELSDGFPSLTDADRQRESFAAQQAHRARRGYPAVMLDEKFLKSLDEGFPKGAGMALGFDRLVMLLTNQTSLAPTLAFDWDEL